MIYIDCGWYAGVAEKLNCVDESWTRYGFEPHPGLEVPEYVSRKAVWIADGTKNFLISGRNDSASLEGTSGHTEPAIIKVKTFDFSKWVGGLPDDTIVCSMDIEGAEFPVLHKMLQDGTIDKISFLDVEFHHRITQEDTHLDADKLIKQIQSRGVIIRIKVPLE